MTTYNVIYSSCIDSIVGSKIWRVKCKTLLLGFSTRKLIPSTWHCIRAFVLLDIDMIAITGNVYISKGDKFTYFVYHHWGPPGDGVKVCLPIFILGWEDVLTKKWVWRLDREIELGVRAWLPKNCGAKTWLRPPLEMPHHLLIILIV